MALREKGYKLRITFRKNCNYKCLVDKMKISAFKPHSIQLIAFIIFLPSLVVHAKPESENVGNPATHRLLVSKKPQCNDKSLLKADRYVSSIMSVGKNGREFPNNQSEYLKYCRDTTKMIAYLEKFVNECFTIENANLAKLILFGLKRMTRVYCNNKQKHKKNRIRFDVNQCLNTAIRKDPCLPRMVNNTKELVPLKIGKYKIDYMCCHFVEMLKCEDRFYNALPCSKPEGVELLVNLIRSVTEDSLNYACGEYTEQTDRCDHIPPLDRSKTDPKLNSDPRFQSIMIPTLELFDSLDQSV